MGKWMVLLGLVFIGLVPLACGGNNPASPAHANPTDTNTPNPPTDTPTTTFSPTNTATPTITNTATVTSTATIAYPTGTFVSSWGINPTVWFTLTNSMAVSQSVQIAVYPYPATGNFYTIGCSCGGGIPPGTSGFEGIDIPGTGNYFVYFAVYAGGVTSVYGFAPMTIDPGLYLSGGIYPTYATLAGNTSNSYCVGCELP
jgi:hypothetical protein